MHTKISLIGNKKISEQITMAVISSIKRNQALPHMLLSGTPGCGKTSTAQEVSKLREVKTITLLNNSLKSKQSINDIIYKLNYENYDDKGNRIGTIKPTILFIDEIHRLSLETQEILGVLMENFYIDSNTPGKIFWIPYFTLIGATTDDGKLSKPFRDRFKLLFNFNPYDYDTSIEIIKYHAKKMGIRITIEGVKEIAKRGKGIPRIMIKYLENARDFSFTINTFLITKRVMEDCFDLIGIDSNGLSTSELNVLKILAKINEPIGLDSLAIAINESKKTLTDTIEPYLIQKQLMNRTGKGRAITTEGLNYLSQSNKIGETTIKKEIDVNYARD